MAHHRIISQARWLQAQKQEAEYWRGNVVLDKHLAYVEKHYAPLIRHYAGYLPADSHILDLGCGPVCPVRFIEPGEKCYVDPLLDTFRRTYPGKLPKGEHLAVATDNIPKPDASFDLIISIDALNRVMNPEFTLNEVRRLLAPAGTFIMGVRVYPVLVAMACYYMECFMPMFRNKRSPYCYAHTGITKTLGRYFDIVEERALPAAPGAGFFGREIAFICKHKKQSDRDA